MCALIGRAESDGATLADVVDIVKEARDIRAQLSADDDAALIQAFARLDHPNYLNKFHFAAHLLHPKKRGLTLDQVGRQQAYLGLQSMCDKLNLSADDVSDLNRSLTEFLAKGIILARMSPFMFLFRR